MNRVDLENIQTNPIADVLVVLSGGQDSATCLYAALATRRAPGQVDGWSVGKPMVSAITFVYGQKHAQELEHAKAVAADAGIMLKVVDMGFLASLVDSALTSQGDVSGQHPRLKELPASFVPNRNALFLTAAHAYAQKIGAEEIWTGVCQTDYSGYPDCRQSFIDALAFTLNDGSKAGVAIVTPLMRLTKAQTWELAELCGAVEKVKTLTLTCYNGIEQVNEWGKGCGHCPACQLRAKGYAEYLANR